MSAFPFTLASLLDGRHRILYAPITVAVPTHLGNIISLASPYTAQTGWLEFGSTRDASTATRSITKNEWNIQQTSAAVNRTVATIDRGFACTAMEYSPALRIIYEESGSGITTVASASGRSAQKTISGGSISSLTPYRVAILAQRPKSVGTVIEASGGVRGGWYGRCYYRMEIAASSGTETFEEGQPVAMPFEFESLLEPTITTEGTEAFIDMAEDLGQTMT